MTDSVMTPDEFARRMAAIETGDPDADHGNADDLLCEVLRSLGYGEGVEIFINMPKWYA